FKQEDVTYEGWAIECRINAENPFKDFMPSPGKIVTYLPPGGLGVRVDSAVYPNYVIPPFYDSMVAKLIAYDKTRAVAIRRMKRVLDEYIVESVDTSIPFHARIMEHDVFINGDFNTDFLEENPINPKITEE